MLLFHNTNLKSLKLILEDNQLKASYLTGNTDEGEGIYESKDQKFIYFSVIDDLKSKYTIFSDVTLYFDPKMLWNRTYYVSNLHSGDPHVLGEWINNKGDKQYKKKYKQYYKNTKSILAKLFKYSISVLPGGRAFQIFQQIALKKQISLKYLKAIKFNKSKPSQSLLKLLSKEYPDVILEY